MHSITQLLLCSPVIIACFFAARHWVRQAPIRKIAGPAMGSRINGNLGQLFNLNAWEFHSSIVRTYGRIVRIWGWFGLDTQLYISDPKALYTILIKEQYVFEESAMFIKSQRLFFGMGLTATLGEHHRRQRKLLNPVFSIGHMKYMIPIFYRVCHDLCNVIKGKVAHGPQEIDMMEWMSRTALELVGQGGLGYSFDALNENARNEYADAVRHFAPALGRVLLIRQLLPWVSDLGPPSFRKWIAQTVPWPDLNRFVEIVDVMHNTSSKIFAQKKAAFEKGEDAVVHQIAEGRDIMSVLMQANMSASEDNKLPESELLAQMSLLILAAMDTTSSALARILHVLSEHQEAQDRLREEVRAAYKASDSGDLDYDTLHELPYLEAVCRETLRLYAPLSVLARTTREDAMVPLESPITVDGSDVSELFIPKDTNVLIGIRAVNRDPALWGTDADEWNPERFLKPLPESLLNVKVPGVYANLLTFLGGGRACIGFKFSQMEMKIVLSLLISKFRFSPSKKQVTWASGTVAMPYTQGTPTPSLPLVVSLVD